MEGIEVGSGGLIEGDGGPMHGEEEGERLSEEISSKKAAILIWNRKYFTELFSWFREKKKKKKKKKKNTSKIPNHPRAWVFFY